MKAKTQKYYIYYRLDSNFYNNFNFVQAVKICKYPRQTKEYKRLKFWLDTGLIDAVGYCEESYFNENKEQFVTNSIN